MNGAFKVIQIRTQKHSKHSSVYLLTHWDTGGARGHTSPLQSPPSFGVFHDLYWLQCLSDPNPDHVLEPRPISPLHCALFMSAIARMPSGKHWAVGPAFLLFPVIFLPTFLWHKYMPCGGETCFFQCDSFW